MYDDDDKAAPDQQQAMSHNNLARRKAILRGLGKTAAVAGAAAPLTTLAGARLRFVNNGQSLHCSDSGQGSVLMSGAVSQIPLCSGFRSDQFGYTQVSRSDPTAAQWPTAATKPVAKAHWTNWPNDGTNAVTVDKDGNKRTPAATFAGVFGGGSSTRLGALLIQSPNGAEAQWLTALLNAQKKYPASWPHSPTEVITQYQGANQARALALYTKINKPA